MAQQENYKRWHYSTRNAYDRWSDLDPEICEPDPNEDPNKDECQRNKDGKNGLSWYKRRITCEHADWPLDGGCLNQDLKAYEYADEMIKDDQLIAYKSDKYSFLEAVYKYKIFAHQPHDHVSFFFLFILFIFSTFFSMFCCILFFQN